MNETGWIDWAIAISAVALVMWGLWSAWIREADEFADAKRREKALQVLEDSYNQDHPSTDVDTQKSRRDPKNG